MTGTLWTRLAAELRAYGEALAALKDDAAAIDHARLRRIEDELAALSARVTAMRPEPDIADAERARRAAEGCECGTPAVFGRLVGNCRSV
ncbi:hypothetical protein [Bosea sp. (in: a-proteobacteria)]|uniref:hypothetical protein n=1 Tax=Bosea sp. (in: a-proteobacteria) TaxID=1871050 RepID=UPI004034F5B2